MKHTFGFTRSETIIVTAIILFLGLMANYHFNLAQSKSRDFERKIQLKNIANTLEDYRIDTGAYPPNTNDLRLTGCGDPLCPTEKGQGIPCEWKQNATPTDLTCGEYIYLQPVPRAPANPKVVGLVTHHYLRSEKQKIILETCMELKSDVEIIDVDQSLTGFTLQNCRSGVIFQIKK